MQNDTSSQAGTVATGGGALQPVDSALQEAIKSFANRITPPTTEELYDGLMVHIEPDLVSKNRAESQKPRDGETPEQTHTRKAGYKQALAQYAKALDTYTALVQGFARSIQRDAMTSIEEAQRAEEGGGLAALEQSLANA